MGKFYAVRKGSKPGIYTDWETTKAQVNGFPGAIYKGFKTRSEADSFMSGSAKSTSRSSRTKTASQTTTRTEGQQAFSGKPEIIGYTDGGSRNTGNVNGGHVRDSDKAAWAYRLELPNEIISDSDGEWGATNNRMEIMAFMRALEMLIKRRQQHAKIQLVLDSQYVLNAVTKGWLKGWKKRGWKRSAGELANAELWQKVDQLLPKFTQLEFAWTKGHATNVGNVFVDELLNKTMDRMVADHPVVAQKPRVTTKPKVKRANKPVASAKATTPAQPVRSTQSKPTTQPVSKPDTRHTNIDHSVADIQKALEQLDLFKD
ncbi:ribonuclease H family protein [Secundilactobacillus similis DSM 23365 = JCM 2765]|uniref:ribonuclease H n=1 Tax=Secundilactobacillus similis DSM 23365 = JCM 2765 TaxID=1423804 RepID=A0A0R2F462_9LACO|nr:ribonuclease H family protein [Secundilactobacillus similis]KRN19962.1 ribonuclease h [Secundilactobacillus similis DSM 23365 = JCM 2765]